jgi:hypothetical protein
LVVILIVVGFIFRNSKPKEEVKINENPIVQTEGLVVSDSYKTKVLNPDDSYVTFDVKYPFFKNADASFNSSIETLIKTQMDDHKKASEEYWQARIDTATEGENIPKVPTKEDKLSFIADFTIVQSNSTYISFIENCGGFSGGAHGYEVKASFNYDVVNKKVIALKDLFPSDPQYLLNSLSTTSRLYLKSQFATVSEEDKKNSDPQALKEYVDNIISTIESGTDPTEENFSVFTFTPDKIKIYFAQYQVGPYSIGMPEVEVDRI